MREDKLLDQVLYFDIRGSTIYYYTYSVCEYIEWGCVGVSMCGCS